MTTWNTYGPWPVLPAETITLTGGTPCCVTRGGQQDVVQISCMVKTDMHRTPNPLADTLTVNMLQEGTTHFTSEEISDRLDFHGASLSLQCTDDAAVVSLMTLRRHLPDVLPLLAEMLFAPVFPADQFRLQLEQSRQRHLIDMEQNQNIARECLLRMLYGTSHIYGRPIEDSDFGTLQPSDIVERYRTAFDTSSLVFFVSGRMDDADLRLVDRHLGHWTRPSRPDPVQPGMPPCAPESHHSVRLHREEEPQTTLRIGGPVCPFGSPDTVPLQLLNTVLGGYFNSRLMQNLRAVKGWTYGVHSLWAFRRFAGHLVVQTDVRQDVTEKALQEIWYEMDRLQQQPVGEAELAMARQYALGAWIRNFDGPFMQETLRLMACRQGISGDYFSELFSGLSTCTAEQVMQAARKYLQRDRLYEVAVGNLSGMA